MSNNLLSIIRFDAIHLYEENHATVKFNHNRVSEIITYKKSRKNEKLNENVIVPKMKKPSLFYNNKCNFSLFGENLKKKC